MRVLILVCFLIVCFKKQKLTGWIDITPQKPAKTYTDCWFISKEKGWVSSGSKIYYTVDGGKTWNITDFDKDRISLIFKFFFLSENEGWALCTGYGELKAAILHWDGNEWKISWKLENKYSDGNKSYICSSYLIKNPSWWDIYFSSPDNGYAALGSVFDSSAPRNERPLMLHWDGEKWSEFKFPQEIEKILLEKPGRVHAVWCNEKEIWVGVGDIEIVSGGETTGMKPCMLHYKDGKWEWVDLPNELKEELAWPVRIFFLNEDEGYAICYPCDILYWDGKKWNIIYTTTIFDMHVFSSNDIWFVGPALFEKYDGDEWYPITEVDSIFGGNYCIYRGIHALDKNYIWIVGDYWSDSQQRGFILKYVGQE